MACDRKILLFYVEDSWSNNTSVNFSIWMKFLYVQVHYTMKQSLNIHIVFFFFLLRVGSSHRECPVYCRLCTVFYAEMEQWFMVGRVVQLCCTIWRMQFFSVHHTQKGIYLEKKVSSPIRLLPIPLCLQNKFAS